MALSKSSVHVDRPLTNMTLKYANSRDHLIGASVLPMLPVANESDKYFTFTQSDAYSIPNNMEVNANSEPIELEWGLSTATYTCQGYATKQFIPQELIESADSPLDLRFATLTHGIDLALLAYEDRVATLVTTAGNYAAANKTTLSGTGQFSDDSSDVIGTVQDAVEGCFIKANTIAMGLDTFKAIRKHPQIMDALPASSVNSASGIRSALADIFDVNEVLIGRAKKNTAQKGQTASYSDIWGDYLLAFHKIPTPAINAASFGYTFAWNAVGGAAGYLVTRWDNQSRGTLGGEYVKVAQKLDEAMVAANLGYLISDCVA